MFYAEDYTDDSVKVHDTRDGVSEWWRFKDIPPFIYIFGYSYIGSGLGYRRYTLDKNTIFIYLERYDIIIFINKDGSFIQESYDYLNTINNAHKEGYFTLFNFAYDFEVMCNLLFYDLKPYIKPSCVSLNNKLYFCKDNTEYNSIKAKFKLLGVLNDATFYNVDTKTFRKSYKLRGSYSFGCAFISFSFDYKDNYISDYASSNLSRVLKELGFLSILGVENINNEICFYLKPEFLLRNSVKVNKVGG